MIKAEEKYPQEFTQQMKATLGDEYPSFVESLDAPPPVSLRMNPYKLSEQFQKNEKITWCEGGRYLPERPSFTFDPLFHAGSYYVQEASSMFLEQIWQQINPENKTVRVLDMCAAPGGKSTHLLSLMSGDSLLVSNEVISHRNKVLQENITKWGTANCIVTQNKAENFSALQNYFDIILVDAPCSGEGLFRKDKAAIEEWDEKNVAMCSLRQKEILRYALYSLKPGGFLIYSTCTYEPDENDHIISWLNEFSLSPFPLPVVKDNIVKTNHGYQFFPHRVKGEGFYISLLKKEETTYSEHLSNNVKMLQHSPYRQTNNTKLLCAGSDFLSSADDFTFIEKKELLFAIPNHLFNDFQSLSSQLYIRQAGIFMGAVKGKDFIPSHDLALSVHLKKELPSVELSLEQAIAYLRCESIFPLTDHRGWVLARYKGFNIGWLKIMESRANNYYPKEWRILKQGNFTKA